MKQWGACFTTMWPPLFHLHLADFWLLEVSMRPYYLPREFSHAVAVVVVVYIPPSTVPHKACDVIHCVTAKILTQFPNAFLAVSGDVSHVSISSTLPIFHPFVICTIRDNRTLDLLFCIQTLRMHTTLLLFPHLPDQSTI